VPFALIQSAGRPSLTARLHLFELPWYLLAVWELTKHLGIEGAAIAWTARIALDTFLLFVFADRTLQHQPRFLLKLTGSLTAALLVLGAATLPQTVLQKAVFCAAALLVFALIAFKGMSPDERHHLQGFRRRKSLKIQSSSV
jgi:O-antigen/teichoic acid export membrane protein